MSALPKRWFTPEEYLALEESAPYKSQYVAGEIFAMAGAPRWHQEVVGNIFAGLHRRLLARPCKVFASEMRVQCGADASYYYPDVVALCGELKFSSTGNPPSLLNPQVIFEALSPSTEPLDRNDKFRDYRRIETLTDYILVTVERMRVEHYWVQPNGVWACDEYGQPLDILPLVGLACEIPLAEIYRAVEPAQEALGR